MHACMHVCDVLISTIQNTTTSARARAHTHTHTHTHIEISLNALNLLGIVLNAYPNSSSTSRRRDSSVVSLPVQPVFPSVKRELRNTLRPKDITENGSRATGFGMYSASDVNGVLCTCSYTSRMVGKSTFSRGKYHVLLALSTSMQELNLHAKTALVGHVHPT